MWEIQLWSISLLLKSITLLTHKVHCIPHPHGQWGSGIGYILWVKKSSPSYGRDIWLWGRFKSDYELLLNLTPLNFHHMWIKSTSFNAWVIYFCVELQRYRFNSTQNILPTHRKMPSVYNVANWGTLRFKSSNAFSAVPGFLPIAVP